MPDTKDNFNKKIKINKSGASLCGVSIFYLRLWSSLLVFDLPPTVQGHVHNSIWQY